ncbi:hypothetical protein [Enterococcus faecium]|uniref:hypothetical protein n=1 Tax=Enterococcus faecium TaxID=1352 RepID=UPI0015E3B37C|nr:hypothetical protein [Enterococcus faecium]EGP4917754.1 hypothetical protein [Enterococcus faecium]EME3506726.1 hypothetical protein [Enterococcus faecium]EMF0334010.1 hypothetical protein [Enterococcus faecium]EMF0419036.1 hypothetical protein [Enterococcus faecium]EMF0453204.1 hypothetical protein [Enterococcus faecium]
MSDYTQNGDGKAANPAADFKTVKNVQFRAVRVEHDAYSLKEIQSYNRVYGRF